MRFKNNYERNKFLKKHGLSFFRWFFLLALGYIVLFQLFYMISYAIRPVAENYNYSVIWVPKTVTLENFKIAAEVMEYGKSFFRTVSVGLVSAAMEVVTCAVIAYGFARFEFPERNIVFFLVILTILIPPQMILSSTYMNYSHLDFLGILKGLGALVGKELRPNILDTAWTFYLPSLFGIGLQSGLFIFIYRQFFVKLPRELEEAAWVDGSGPVRTFVSVILPSSKVVILTVSIFSVIWHWNDYYLSSMYLGGELNLSTRLANLAATLSVSGYSDSRNIRMAACLLFAMPMLAMYIILQKQFIKSIDHVGIVG